MKAIVTGHTRGLGLALATALLARGITVLGLARQHQPDLQQRFGALLQQHPLDLADAGALQRWLAGPALADFVAGDDHVLLLNNAGTVQPVGRADQLDPANIASAISLNVSTPLMLASAVLAATPPAAQRRILHVSSGAAVQAYPGWSIYCASKAALDHHARALAADAIAGVRICSLAPGVIDTDMQAEIRASDSAGFPSRERFVQLKTEGALTLPAQAAERMVDYLLSDAFGSQPTADLRQL
jgi:NAD(P)-dependent dehydrogenase (short-subunit alcohol dehydrogenase family)